MAARMIITGYANPRVNIDGKFEWDAQFSIVDIAIPGAIDAGQFPVQLDPANTVNQNNSAIDQAAINHVANVISFPSALTTANIKKPQFI